MNSTRTFPEDLHDFLKWVKETTEAYWENVPQEDPTHGVKWLPLTDQQIDDLEQQYAIKFGVEHRAFLRILHTLDKNYRDIAIYGQEEQEELDDQDKEMMEYYKNESEEARKKREFWTPPYAPSYFYNWITEKEWIESRLAWIDDFYISEILHGSWLRSWGPRPESNEEKIRIFRDWYRKAPQLLPIRAHTFLMDDGGRGLRPVMSVYGFDTIIAAWSLRHYLFREFGTALGLTEMIHEEDEDYPEGISYPELVRGIPEIEALQTIALNDADIPYWREVLHYYNNPPDRDCWQGFWVPQAKPIKDKVFT